MSTPLAALDSDDWQNWHAQWSSPFHEFVVAAMAGADSGHDVAHVSRVVRGATNIGRSENADARVVLPAAWLHDCVIVPKDSPNRSRASRMAAERATEFLNQIGYESSLIPDIQHAIIAHSFSANVPPKTLEAKVVQDADRLEALGALGLARCLATGGAMGVKLLDPDEPFPFQRPADDSLYSVDHLFVKLLRLPAQMQTNAGRTLATQYADFLILFLRQLAVELFVTPEDLERALLRCSS
jgi:uncharacterized protein